MSNREKDLRRKVSRASATIRKRLLVLGLLAVIVIVGLWAVLRRQPSPHTSGAAMESVPLISPPVIETEGTDPAVVQAIDRDRSAVLEQLGSSAAWGALAMTLMAHDFNHEAAECYSQAEALDREDARWPYLHARAILSSDPQGAVPLLERAVQLTGNTPGAVRLTLCETLLEVYRLDEAESHLSAYLVEHSGDPRARLAQARLAFMRADYATCLKQLQDLTQYLRAQGLYQGRTQPLLLLMAEALRRNGRGEQAERIQQQAMAQAQPGWPDPFQKQVNDRMTGLKTHLVEADLMYGRGDYDQAIALLQTAVESYPESTWAKIHLARALIRTGAPDSNRPDAADRLERAEALLEQALRLDPNSAEAVFRLGVAKGYQEMWDEAAHLYERAVELKPDFTIAYHNLAHCRSQLHDSDRAIAAAEAALAIEPTFVDGLGTLAILLMREGRYQEAEQRLEAAVQLRPNDSRLQRLLTETRRQGAPQDAP